MAAPSIPGTEPIGFGSVLARRACEVLGVGLLVLAVFLAVALWGHDANDPSLNNATAGPSTNPLGALGALVADLCLQMLGYASWLLVGILPCWALRLIFAQPLAWPWLPVVALPPTLLASAAYLATLGLPQQWPYWVGLGGFVGDFLLHRLERPIGAETYPLVAIGVAAVCLLPAVGLSLSELWQSVRWLVALPRGGATQEAEAAPRWAEAVDQRLGTPESVPVPGGRPRTGGFGFISQFLGGLGARLRRQGAVEPFAPGEAGADPVAARRRRPGAGAPALSSLDEGDPAKVVSRVLEGRRGRPPASPSEPAKETRKMPPAATEELVASSDFELPPLKFLTQPRARRNTSLDRATLAETARDLEKVLDDFGVRGEIVDVRPGPVVTLYELEPSPGTRAARVISLADDIARSLCAMSVRVAVVPGRNVIGIELPNEVRETVYLRDLLAGPTYTDTSTRLTLALGKDIGGESIVVDLARMPHLLIAGTTGAGKSVAINAMILSLLYRLPPDECKLIMIDPKVIELSVYEGIPHLLAPVVTEPHKAVVALKWVVREMDERYRLMSHLGVRDIFAFNRRLGEALDRGEQLSRRVQTGFEPGTGVPVFEQQPLPMTKMPLIVVIVDEVADLMMTAGKEIEAAIQRLSQKARAAGVHLIVATQRPSVDVLTGVIKANLPSRISFRVSSKIDSRTILGEPGAEQLLGQGDMLYMMPGERVIRIHGPLVTDGEVERVVTYLREQGSPDYVDAVTEDGALEAEGDGPPLGLGEPGNGEDAQYGQAMQIVAREGKASTSFLQRKMRIGYNSAARLIERLEADGHVSQPDHVGRRQVLMGANEDGKDEAPWSAA